MIYKNREKILEERIYETKEGNRLPLLTFSMLEHIPGIRHCFTTRAGGVSEGIFRSLTGRQCWKITAGWRRRWERISRGW